MAEQAAPPEADELGRALARWVDELDRLVGEEGPEAPWMREDVAPVFGQLEGADLPILNAGAVAAAILTGSGAMISATPAFRQGRSDELLDPALLAAAAAGAPPAYRTVSRAADGADETGVVVYAPGSATATWRLPPDLHEVARTNRNAVVVLTAVVDSRAAPLRDACIAYGLTGLQTRVALETIRVGAIKAAAENLGLSYQTAREALSEAMKRLGAERLPALVTRLTTLAFGVFPGRPGSADVLADVWGLTERQIAIAGMLAEGASREQVAQVLGVSFALVKKELDAVYSLLHVRSAAALARKMVEARALGWMTAATAGGIGFVEDQPEPLRFALRPDGGRIAFSDYGPASGRPVLVLHSSMTTRIVSRKLLRALHHAGYRPIAIDRPGFGLSDPLPAGSFGDPFVAAAADVPRVLELLRIRRADIISRGAAQFLVSLAAAMPEAIGQVVLVNPGPPYAYSGRSLGPIGVMKEAFVRNPATIRVMAPFLAGQLTYRRLSKMLVQWTRGSPPDQLAAHDPAFVADFFRSVRMFATGRYEGFLAEQAAISRGGPPLPFSGAAGWRILLGASDVLYEPEVVLRYWRERLPGARFDVASDGGRFLAMTHPQLVVRALEG